MTKKVTAEYVSLGHPDKICDYTADKILDYALAGDPNSHVACEVLVTTNTMVIAGEITSKTKLNLDKIAREAVSEIGYSKETIGFDPRKIKIINLVKEQSSDINMGVASGDDQGAGDQGIIFGYACDDNKYFMPNAFVYARDLITTFYKLVKDGDLKGYFYDAKSEVTINEETGEIINIVFSCHHHKDKNQSDIKDDIIKVLIPKTSLYTHITDNTNYQINKAGQFIIGGPVGDTGVTGRKIIVDTYGGFAHHGGGAFSGKDASKVDRSAAYMARYLAKNIVASGLAKKCEIMISYVIGVSEPVNVSLDLYNTSSVDEEKLAAFIKANFDLRPAKIIKKLELLKPGFARTSLDGHFFGDFSWEQLDLVETFKKFK